MRSVHARRLIAALAAQALVCLACVNYFSRTFGLSRWLLAVHLPLVAAVLGASLLLSAAVLVPRRLRDHRAAPYLAATPPALAMAALLLLYAANFASNLWMGTNVTHKLAALWITDWWAGGTLLPLPRTAWIWPLAFAAVVLAVHWMAGDRFHAGVRALAGGRWTARSMAAPALVLAGYGWFGYELSWRTPRSELLSADPILAFLRTTVAVQDDRQIEIEARLRRDEPICRAGYPRGLPFERRHVIIIIADSLRADHMQVYGYPRPTTPFLEAELKAGRLRRVGLATSTCAESNCGILSTLFSKRLRHQVAEAFKLPDLLNDQGYATYFILSGNHDWQGLREKYGYEHTVYFDGRDSARYGRGDDRLLFEGLERVPDGGPPAFFYFHLMATHFLGDKLDEYRAYNPSQVVNDWTALFRGDYDAATVINNYDNGVLQADDTLRQLFAALDRKGYLQNSIVAILGDHGEGLGERGPRHFGHVTSLYQEFINIPLLFWESSPGTYPNLEFGTQVDVAPTMVDRLGLPVPACWEGLSLLGDRPRRESVHQTSLSTPCFAILDRSTDSTYKYLYCTLGRREALFNLTRDPHERTDLLLEADPALVERLRARLREWRGE